MAEELAIVINAKDGFSSTFSRLDTRVEASRRYMERATDASRTFTYALGGLAVAAGTYIFHATLTAARTETLGIAMHAVARATGTSTKVLAEQEKVMKKQGITTQEARSILALFMQSELDVAQASKIARVAQDLAVISNQNSSDAARTLTDAIASQEPMLLRQFGIVKNLPEIYEKYGRQLGLVSDEVDKNGKVTQSWSRELTEAEKKQAFLNIILEQGAKVTGVYEDAMTKAGKKLTSLARFFEEAANTVGNYFLPALNKGIDVLTDFLKSITTENIEKWTKKVYDARLAVILLGGAIAGMTVPSLMEMTAELLLNAAALGPWAIAGAAAAGQIYLLWKYSSDFNTALSSGPASITFWIAALLMMISPLAAIAGGILLVQNHWQTFEAWFSSFVATHRGEIDSIKGKLDEWWMKTLEIIDYIRAKYNEYITSPEYLGLKESFADLTTALKKLRDVVTGETVPSLDTLKGKKGEVKDSAKAAKDLIDAMTDALRVLTVVATFVVGGLTTIVDAVRTLERAARWAADGVAELYNWLTRVSKTWYGSIIFPGVSAGRQLGGVVPGSPGRPVPILAHGGEYVLPGKPASVGTLAAATHRSVIHTHVYLDGKQVADVVDYHQAGVGENI